MKKKITVADLMTAAEKKAAKRKAKYVDFINRLLSIMENGKEYRCKELAKMMEAQGYVRGSSIPNISRCMRKLIVLNMVKRIEKDGEPRTFNDYCSKKLVVNDEVYYSAKLYDQERTVIPKIAYFSLV